MAMAGVILAMDSRVNFELVVGIFVGSYFSSAFGLIEINTRIEGQLFRLI